jgi:outer membrane receptor protein involved in Fe transport
MTIRTALLTGASLAALLACAAAHAQQAATSPPSDPAATAEQANSQPKDTIVITGSRIARSDYVAESPVMTVAEDAIENRGPATLESTFNSLPQFAATNTAATSSPARQGRNNANLRGLGIQRTLILMDGRRMQPSDEFGAVDLNTIPTALIKNVEVITGGASAVYGSDAIAGVINFKLNKDFEGLELDGSYGITDRDDSQAVTLSAAMGGHFADDRGHFIGALTYYNRDAAERASRPFFERSGIASALRGGYILADSTNLPTTAGLSGVFSGYGVTTTPARNVRLGQNLDGTLFTTTSPVLNLRYPDSDPYIVEGGRVGYPIGNSYPLQPPIDRYTVFLNGGYDINDHLEAYLQANHVQYESAYQREGWSAGSSDPQAFIPVTNPFVSADMRAVMATRSDPDAPMNFTFSTSRIGQSKYKFNYDLNEILIGLRGDIPGTDWTWDLYGSYGTTTGRERSSGFIDINAWNTLVNSPTGGADICPGGFDPFLPQILEETPGQEACFNYLNRNLSEETRFQQQIVEASMQGGLVDLPAGQLRFAAGLNYRYNRYDYAPPNEKVFGTAWPVQLTGPTTGSNDVYEAFGELYIPVVKDLPLVKELNVDLAYRYSDYRYIGGVNTYKGSVDWSIGAGFRGRGGYQRAIRAPSLGELFAPPERGSAGVGPISSGGGDPCAVTSRLRDPARNPDADKVRTLCIATGVPGNVVDLLQFVGSAVPGVDSGNTNLQQETADTYTAGLVWDGNFDLPVLHRVSASLDYYNISVEDAIGQITASVSLARCFNDDGQSNPTYDPNNYFCGLTDRNVGGSISLVRQPTLNLAAYEVSGFDFQTDASLDLYDLGWGNIGKIDVNLVVSKLESYKLQNLAGEAFLDYVGTIGNGQIDSGAISFPEWKTSLNLTYTNGPIDVSVSHRWYASMTNSGDVGVANPTQPGVSSRQYVDLNAKWRISDDMTLRAGVLNVFDVEPPEWTGYGATDVGLYDLLQRRFHVGLTKRF